jgi:hypothetical protein
MMEVLSESVRLANLPFTILLGCVVVYWLLMSLGLFNFDSGSDVDVHADVDAGDVGADVHADMDADVHADVHADMHADVDGDADAHTDVDAGAEPGLVTGLLQFLNLGQVPLMVVLSIMALCMWMISMTLNYYWSDGSALRWGLFLAGNLVVTVFLTHFLTKPFKALFKALNKEYEEHTPIIGRTCTITTSEANAQFGQAQIETKGAPILINVRTSEAEALKKGETGLVIKEDKDKNIYSVVKVTAAKLKG